VPTQQAALSFVEKVTAAAKSGLLSGQTSLTVTQAEVTSFLSIASQLAQVMNQLEGIENPQDLRELQDLDIEGLRLQDLDLDSLGDENLDGDALSRWQALAQEREGLGGLSLPDLSLRLAIQEPQVYFKAPVQPGRPGQIVIRGYGQVRNVRQPLRLVVAPHAREGELALDFVEGQLGPVPLPEGLIDVLGRGLAKVILAGQGWAELDEITVGDGWLTLRGRYSKENSGTSIQSLKSVVPQSE
jgi:hypothetical protein